MSTNRRTTQEKYRVSYLNTASIAHPSISAKQETKIIAAADRAFRRDYKIYATSEERAAQQNMSQATFTRPVPLKTHHPEPRVENSAVKKVIIAIPGWGDNCDTFDALAKEATKKGFTLVSYDPDGSGFSKKRRSAHPREQLQEIQDFYQKMQEKYPNADFVFAGHSMGGAELLNPVTQDWIQKNEKIKGTICLAPAVSKHWWSNLTLSPTHRPREDSKKSLEHEKDPRFSFFGNAIHLLDAVRGLLQHMHKASQGLSQYTQSAHTQNKPIVVLNAEEDLLVNTKNVTRFFSKELQTPHSKFKNAGCVFLQTLPFARHTINMPRNTRNMLPDVADYADQLVNDKFQEAHQAITEQNAASTPKKDRRKHDPQDERTPLLRSSIRH